VDLGLDRGSENVADVVNFKDLPDSSAKSGLLDCRWGFVAPVLAAISCVMPRFLRKTPRLSAAWLIFPVPSRPFPATK